MFMDEVATTDRESIVPLRNPSHIRQLVVFARAPQVGHNKTRLIPALGPAAATEVYRFLANRTLESVRQLVAGDRCNALVHFTGGSRAEMQAAFGEDLDYCEQQGATLGERLKYAIGLAFSGGARRVVVIGTDCPDLSPRDIAQAFDELHEHDVVVGPALDGGYYLIGMHAFHPGLFDDIDWSTSQVFEQTVQRANALGLKLHTLRRLSDVDYPEDLLALRNPAPAAHWPINTTAGRMSIVVPTLNEAEHLPATLRAIGRPSEGLEVIVVDGGSSDTTVELAQHHGCQVFTGNRGRARQMNAGAAIATGEFLLFLHADTILPQNYRQEVERILARPVQAGAFPLRIDAQGQRLGLRIVEFSVAFRSRFMQMPYGDQALFFRSADFFEQAGYKNMALMEDYELMQRTRKRGPIGVAELPVRTSGRRWQKQGLVKTTLINQLCVLAFRLGYSDATIARLYKGRDQ
jgi:rSAM/selenodomain-associated transferase 2/rSAM/selenodomain-associated transferase 1